jgi:hypothetical protein
MSYINIEYMDNSIDSKSKPLHSTNIWTNGINNEVNDPRPTIFVTNTINIEHYDLRFDFVIQSSNGSNQKSQFLKDENFTKSSYSMAMEEFQKHNSFKKLHEEQRLIFDDVMHRKQLYPNTPICLFLTRGVGTGKTFTLKLIIQGLLQLYNRDIFFDLTKTKALLMASTSKITFNINDLTIHSTLNIHVQQSLSSLPNLSSNSLNRLACQYEQLQLVVIDEISFVGVKMFNGYR